MTCASCHRRGRHGLGDDAGPLSFLTGSSMGTPIGMDASAYLAAQVNRFTGPNVPSDLRVVDAPLPVERGQVSPALAVAAMFVLQLRSIRALPTDPLAIQTLADAARNTGNPVAYVTSNIAAVTQTIQQFGDQVGLPKASILESLSTTALVVGVGVVGVGVLFALGIVGKKGGR